VIRRQIEGYAPEAVWVEAIHQPLALRSLAGTNQPLAALAGQRVAAFCGIGNPPAFAIALERLGCQLVGLRIFADHWAYSLADFKSLSAWAAAERAVLICTMKDLVKIPPTWLHDQTLWALEIGLAITAGEGQLAERLDQM
jgi:tetraacyldisaccharide 4'-kinase